MTSTAWDYVVAYGIPGPLYRWWTRWVWRPLRYRSMPWAKSACDTCPECQRFERWLEETGGKS